MRYLPHTPSDIQTMLQSLGLGEIDDLFASVPQLLRLTRPLDLPPALSEIGLRHRLRELSRRNAHGEEWASFLGAGAYSHYIPSVVGQLLLRGEYLTAYTPYQPEVSQGTLQAIFEFQTMIAEILGMEVANASVYDGSTGTAEAVLMAQRITDRPRVLIARTVPPEYREVLRTYLAHQDSETLEIPYRRDGTINREEVLQRLGPDIACLVVAVPNFFGVFEDVSELAEALHAAGSLLITVTPEPFALGVFKPPGEMGADIAVAEGQSIGNPLGFGGPSLGLFATQGRHVRSLPGRLVGETVDTEGRRGYVLTLATREQHIRRERATSNICTNVSLCALGATITLALLGKKGFEQLSLFNYQRSEGLKKRLAGLGGISLPFAGTTFNEFVVRFNQPTLKILEVLRGERILGGVPLDRWYPEIENGLLVSLTEMTSDEQVDRLCRVLGEA